MEVAGHTYELLALLAVGESSKVYSAQRRGAMPLLATLKISTHAAAAMQYEKEAQALRSLQALQSQGAAYFSQRIPQVLGCGMVQNGADGQAALVLRHTHGFWGSLEAVHLRQPQGIEARHAVWMLRRMLEVLGFIHAQAWCHSSVRPDHALVHPGDHGVLLINWADAHAGASVTEMAKDLQSAARVIRVLLCGDPAMNPLPHSVAGPIAELVDRASQDLTFCQQHGAAGIDTLLKAAALKAYGPPQFVHFQP